VALGQSACSESHDAVVLPDTMAMPMLPYTSIVHPINGTHRRANPPPCEAPSYPLHDSSTSWHAAIGSSMPPAFRVLGPSGQQDAGNPR